ncbi:DUF2497 domain-containing protein [Pontixanthobacter sp.]|uniref:DUF2497 domain-containing protein n=1 Tax=Pontixanthobacter sp. TaxID=2792078 RepID=UPI003C7E2C16
MNHNGEASVEEILESIKKVIARDNRSNAVGERQRRATNGMSEAVSVSLEADDEEADGEEAADDVLDLGSAAFFESEAEEDAIPESPLIGEAVRNSMRENLAALAMMSEPSKPPQIVRSGETSLEGMVREMVRPMLAEWLDANLPDMVETMVRDEISRIAGKRG